MEKQMITCIGCGCTEQESCWWIRLDRAHHRGICHDCAEHTKSWDEAERKLQIDADQTINQISPVTDMATIEN